MTEIKITKTPATRVSIPQDIIISGKNKSFPLYSGTGRNIQEATARALQVKRVEAQRQTELEAKEKDINKKMNQAILEARQSFARDIREFKNIQSRQERLTQMQNEIRQAQNLAKQQKENLGIPTTKEKVKTFMEKTRLSKVAGTILYPLETGVKRLKEFEQQQYSEGRGSVYAEEQSEIYRQQQEQEQYEDIKKEYEKNKIPIADMVNGAYRYETLSEYIQRTKPRWSGSLTQEYFEAGTGVLERINPEYFKKVEFYGEGEQQALTEEGKPASTNKWGNVLIGASDILFKGALFSPAMETATSRRGRAKKKQEQELVYRRQFGEDVEVNVKDVEKLNRFTEKLRTLSKEGRYSELKSELVKVAENINKMEGIERDVAIMNFRQYLINLKAEGTIPNQAYAVQEVTGTIEFHMPYTPSLKGIEYLETGSSLLGQSTSQKTKQIELLSTAQAQKERTKQKVISVLSSSQSQKQKEKLKQQTTQLLGLLQISKTKQKEALKLRQKLKQQSKYRLKPKYEPFPKFFLPETSAKSKIKEIAENILSFEAFGKVKGQDILLGTFPTQYKAEEKLKGFLKGTLGASGFIEKKGKKISPKEFGLFSGFSFRVSKINPFRIVQRRGKRLSSASEVFQIQRAKKRKGGTKINWFS